jgi:hypothetical protein
MLQVKLLVVITNLLQDNLLDKGEEITLPREQHRHHHHLLLQLALLPHRNYPYIPT